MDQILDSSSLCLNEAGPPLRVLSISHSAVCNGAPRLRYDEFAHDRQFDLTLLVPQVWYEYGKRFDSEPSRSALDLRIMPTRLARGGPAKWYLHHYPGLAGLLRDLRPDVIHLWEEPWSAVALQAALLRDHLLPNAALLLETDQNILRRLPMPFEAIRRCTLRRTDLLIARSNEAIEVARQCGFAGPTEIVEYGTDADVFFPRDRGTERKALNVDGLTLGYVGRLIAAKGLYDVLDALARCQAPINFVLLGEGPEASSLLAYAAELGLEGRVRLLDPRPPEQVARFMAAMDAVVLMSRTTRTWKEQFGRVIMEAQACGVPVIGSSSGSIPDVVGPGGWIVPESDAPVLSTLLSRLAGQPEELRQVGEIARQYAERRFSNKVIAAALRRAWKRAAALRGNRA